MASTYNKGLNQLSALKVSRTTDPGFYSDGGGLGLQVTKAGVRFWVFRYMLAGKQRKMGLGPFPEVSLAAARDLAATNRSILRSGRDPITARNADLVPIEAKKVPTFDEAAAAYIDAHSPTWRNDKHRDQWTNTLATYASPHFGNRAVDLIDTEVVLKALKPIWLTKNETATRVRQRVETVLDWATVQKMRSGDNPARWRGHMSYLLPAPDRVAPVVHHPALPFATMADFMVDLRQLDSLSARALEFTILTAVRTGETLGAVPAEFDLAKAIWTIPKERMKARRDHRVPLGPRALEIASERIEAEKASGTKMLFPGARKGRPLSNMAMLQVVRGMTWGHLTVHGFRSTFRDWAAERTAYANEVVEMALAHTVGNATEAAYRRGDMLERRAPLMAEWEDYCLAKASEGRGINP
ncbi:tyrosine-type recombinase/integrase [Robbsia andropogonis]|uniref:tyrosine-type recombinase/integrase n=1 Tax=Robbsia andropogonis TaxID=28092 RepID=UPI003D22D79F